jgi:hypothetical protein
VAPSLITIKFFVLIPAFTIFATHVFTILSPMFPWVSVLPGLWVLAYSDLVVNFALEAELPGFHPETPNPPSQRRSRCSLRDDSPFES